MAFEIDEDRAVGAALLEGEVVHAEDPDLADLRQRRGLDPPQQGVARGQDAQLSGQPGTRPAAELEGDREQGLLQAARLAGAGGHHLRQPLAKDTPLAGGLVAEEAPRADLELDRESVPGEV
ncbi:MAG: hypothetical protein ACRDTR_00420 [Rubrobacter sp.]